MKTSAPTKIIFFGEHYVVYGAPALSIAVSQRRVVEFNKLKTQDEDKIIIHNPVYNEGGTIFPDGSWQGHKHVAMYAAIYKYLYEKYPELHNSSYEATFLGDRIFKGMGASSALGAALSLAIYESIGKKVDEEEIFRCAQIGDTIDHGGIPSGVDARTVVHAGMIKFWRTFNPNKYNFEHYPIELPKDTTILIIDTFRGRRVTTGEMVKTFAEKNGIDKKPDELTTAEREQFVKPYLEVYDKVLKELSSTNGDAVKLGQLMLKNQELLKNSGVSSPAIDEAIDIVMTNNGLGAKITGAGGEGGALIALVWKKDIENIKQKLEKKGYSSLELEPTNIGVKLDNNF